MATQEQPTTIAKKYYCHTCKAEITPVPGREELTCPTCSSEFVEEVDPDDPPIRPAPTPSPLSPSQNTVPPVTIPPPMLPQFVIPFGQPTELLPLAQTFHQLIRMHNTTNNNNNRTFTVQAGPIPLNNNFIFK
jgi:DNA-directed RNA polymerase subunit RPC12/RpoP